MLYNLILAKARNHRQDFVEPSTDWLSELSSIVVRTAVRGVSDTSSGQFSSDSRISVEERRTIDPLLSSNGDFQMILSSKVRWHLTRCLLFVRAQETWPPRGHIPT